jgi:hypothetical protein
MFDASQVNGGVIALYIGRQYMKVMVQSKFVIDNHKDHVFSFFFVSYSLVDLAGTWTTVHVQMCLK